MQIASGTPGKRDLRPLAFLGGALVVCGLVLLVAEPLLLPQSPEFVRLCAGVVVSYDEVADLNPSSIKDPAAGAYGAFRFLSRLLTLSAIVNVLAGLILIASAGASWKQWLAHAFLEDRSCANHWLFRHTTWVLLGSFLIGCILLLSMALSARFSYRDSLYYGEGPAETATVCVFLFAAVLLLRSALALRRFDLSQERLGLRLAAAMQFVAAAVLVLVAMEEISWGQHWFGWATPSWIAARNTSDETNLHNMFTAYFETAYAAIALCLLGGLIAWAAVRRSAPFWMHLILPHPNLIGLAGLIALVALLPPTYQLNSDELIEELGATFVLLYALRISAIITDSGSRTAAAWLDGKTRRRDE